MSLSLDAREQHLFTSSGISLKGFVPVLNGTVVEVAAPSIQQHDERSSSLRFPISEQQGVFEIRFRVESETRIAVRYRVENLSPDFTLDSFGICFSAVDGIRVCLRNGYFSWEGSEYLVPTDARHIKGYAMTQLLPPGSNTNLVIGFVRHDRFQHTFTSETDENTSLTVETLWDRKLRADSFCESEELILFEAPQVEQGLREWAAQVAAHAPTPPRHAAQIKGWCSWYNLFAYITEENILEHLRGVAETAQREKLDMHVFQIDDGFTPEMGDWLEVKPQFPRGMKPLLDDIRRAGFTPGLWIAPFMVGNRSRLFREHPDWVVRERSTGKPLAHMKFYGEFRWHKRSEEYYVLDTTHPDAFAYLRQVFRVWRQEWGCEYFKTDFMQFGSEYGPEQAVFHTPGMTRIEIWRRTAEMIREEIGEALWLGCGCPLWAGVGLVDAVRTGRDVGVAWGGERPADMLLRDVANRNFANGILWQADPDCILLRERFHFLSETEVLSLALFAGLCGGVLMTSDALEELSPERLRLWKFLLDARIESCHQPWLGQTDEPVIARVCESQFFRALFLLNTSDSDVTLERAWGEFGVPPPSTCLDWTQNEHVQVNSAHFSCSLAPHESKLLIFE